MKKGIHPENYRPVVFKDMSNGDMFLSRSTCATKDTIEFEGETYPLVKLEISSSSHPFYTGKTGGYSRTCGQVHEPLCKPQEKIIDYFSGKIKKGGCVKMMHPLFRYIIIVLPFFIEYDLCFSYVHAFWGYNVL